MGKKSKKRARNISLPGPPPPALPTPPPPTPPSPTEPSSSKMTKPDKGKDKPPPILKLVFSQGLEGYDETWESLIPLFEQLQLVCPDVANPTLDVLTFAHTAHYFSVLHLENVEEEPDESDNDESFGSRCNINDRTHGVAFDDIKEEDEGSSNLWGSASNPQPLHWQDRPPIGLIFLQSSQNPEDYLRSGELNVGVIIDEKHRRKGYARQAVQKAFEVAFADQHCHRVQAVLVDTPYKDRALSVFMMSGMGHEGVRRRGFRSPWDSEFKDVTYLGLLATDWFIRDHGALNNSRWAPAPKSLWDELFARHQREREELLRWEDRRSSAYGKLKRTSSMETIKQATASAMSDIADDDMYDGSSSSGGDFESVRSGSVASSSSSSAFSMVSHDSPRKRRRTSPESRGVSDSWSSRGGSAPPSSNESEGDDDYAFDDDEVGSSPIGRLAIAPEHHIPEGLRNWLDESRSVGAHNEPHHRRPSPALSDDSDLRVFSDGYATSTSSRWDVVDASGLSDLEPGYEALNIDDDEGF